MKLSSPHSVQSRRLMLVCVLVGLELIAWIAFPKSQYIAGGDIWPKYFMPGNTVFSSSNRLWGHSLIGLGSPQFLPAFVVWGLIGKIFGTFGLVGPAAQFVFLSALLLWEGYGIFSFVTDLFPEYPMASIVAGLALPLSLYNTLIFRNPIQAFALGYFAWFAGLVWRLILRPMPQWRRGAIGGLASMGLAVLAGTPPLVVIFTLWAIFWIVGAWWYGHAFRKTYPGVLLAFGLTGLLNAWWIVSAYYTLFASHGSVQQTFQGPLAWDWVDQHASLLNLLTMQGFWSWPRTTYFPWASWYLSGPYHWMLWALPILALSALLLSKSWRVRILGVLVVITLYVAKGVHAPLGFTNKFLYIHVPYFWLLRDPQMEMDLILYLSLFTLAGIGVSEILLRFRHWTGRSVKWLMLAPAAAFLTVFLLGGAPLISGSAYRVTTAQNIRSVVTVPSDWTRLAAFLNRQRGDSGVLLLPNDDFYQMPYTWGYYGTDQVAQTFIHHPVTSLSPVPTGYFSGSQSYQQLLARLQRRIQYDPHDPIAPLLEPFGIRWIIQRNDVRWNFANRKILSAPYLQYYYSRQPDLTLVKKFGQLLLYRVQSSGPSSALFSGYRQVGLWQSSNNPSFITASARLHGSTPWTTGQTTQSVPISARGREWNSFHSRVAFHASTPGTITVSPKELQISVNQTASHVTVILKGPAVQAANLPPQQWEVRKTLAIDRPAQRMILQLGSNHYVLPQRPGRWTIDSMAIPPGVHNLPVQLWGEQSRQSLQWNPVGNCNRIGPARQLRAIRSHHLTSVTLIGQHAGACVTNATPLSVSNPNNRLWLSVQYRHVEGAPPNYSIRQGNQTVHRQLPSRTRWSTWNQWIDPVSTTLHLFTYAYSAKFPTINRYQAVSRIYAPISNTLLVPIHGQTFSVPKGFIRVPGTVRTRPLWQSKEFAPSRQHLFNAYDVSPTTRSTLVAKKVSSQTFSLQAKKDGLGYQTTITGGKGRLLHISGMAKIIQGTNAPRLTISSNQGHVLWGARFFPARTGWQPFKKTLYIRSNAYPLHLDFYSYASSSSAETVLYKDIQIQPWSHNQGRITWISGSASRLASARLTSTHPTWDRVVISQNTRLLVMHAAYSPYWTAQVSGPSPITLQPVKVDGMLNGWAIPPHRGPLSVTIRFGPQTLYAWTVNGASLMALLLLGLIVLPYKSLVAMMTRHIKKLEALKRVVG